MSSKLYQASLDYAGELDPESDNRASLEDAVEYMLDDVAVLLALRAYGLKQINLASLDAAIQYAIEKHERELRS